MRLILLCMMVILTACGKDTAQNLQGYSSPRPLVSPTMFLGYTYEISFPHAPAGIDLQVEYFVSEPQTNNLKTYTHRFTSDANTSNADFVIRHPGYNGIFKITRFSGPDTEVLVRRYGRATGIYEEISWFILNETRTWDVFDNL